MSLNLIWLVLFKKGGEILDTVSDMHKKRTSQKQNLMWNTETLLPQADNPQKLETEQSLLYLQREHGPVDSLTLASSTVRQ